MDPKETPFPVTFHRKDGVCLKRESEVTGIQVQVPEPGKSLPLIHGPVVFPSKQRMDEAVAKMEVCDQEVYEDYLGTFYHAAESNRATFNNYRQRKFEVLQQRRNQSI